MNDLKLSLPEEMHQFVEEQARNGGYSTADEYIRALIHQEQQRAAEQKLEALLLEGLDSGPAIEVTPEYMERKRAALIERHTRKVERLREMDDLVAIREGLAQADAGDARPAGEVFAELKEQHGL